MIQITARKGIVTRSIFERNKESEQSLNIKCSKCGFGILNYPFYKNGYEKYYHIHCALLVGQLTIEEMENLIKRLTIAIQTKESLEIALRDFLGSDWVVKYQ